MKNGTLEVELKEAGTLSKVLTNEETRVTTSLVIKGRINEDDMKHIQIMNNLHNLDLSGASFCLIDEYQESFVINPYRNILINKNLEEVILPKELAVNNVDLSYCLALKKIVVSGENVVFRGYDAAGMKYCSNIRTIEYKEGVEACNNHFEWEEGINMIEQ